jgi:hypothetical protein
MRTLTMTLIQQLTLEELKSMIDEAVERKFGSSTLCVEAGADISTHPITIKPGKGREASPFLLY